MTVANRPLRSFDTFNVITQAGRPYMSNKDVQTYSELSKAFQRLKSAMKWRWSWRLCCRSTKSHPSRFVSHDEMKILKWSGCQEICEWDMSINSTLWTEWMQMSSCNFSLRLTYCSTSDQVISLSVPWTLITCARNENESLHTPSLAVDCVMVHGMSKVRALQMVNQHQLIAWKC